MGGNFGSGEWELWDPWEICAGAIASTNASSAAQSPLPPLSIYLGGEAATYLP